MVDADNSPASRDIPLPGRGDGVMAVLEFGPTNRPYDLVFLHANGFNALTYRKILAPLAHRYRVLAIDQRGHGATTLPTVVDGREHWLDLRDDLLALLTVLDIRGAVLSGHSMGATASLLAAAEACERVRGLLLFDPVIMPLDAPVARPPNDQLLHGALRRRYQFPNRQAVIEAYRGRGAFTSWPEDMLVDYVSGGFIDTQDGGVRLACAPTWEASGYASHGHDSRGPFYRSACPIEVLRAERGSTCRIDDEIDSLVATGRITIETVPGASHFLPMERPELATERLERALRA